MGSQLVIDFSGWCLMRIATDPDPTDELRGASGYTFAFAGEPDLDRLIYFQAPDAKLVPPRSFGPAIGVNVKSARRCDPDGTVTDVPALLGAAVDLLHGPMLQNRNWTLTLPGYEPIVPFHLQVKGTRLRLYREAPLDPQHPELPLWQVDQKKILAQGAAGLAYEPGTVGRGAGIWDPLAFVQRRRNNVYGQLQELIAHGGDPVQIVNLRGRLAELDFALANPGDRRVIGKSFVERFAFPMLGAGPQIEGSPTDFGGLLDGVPPWMVNFWIGGWDADALSGFVQGGLVVPYVAKTC